MEKGENKIEVHIGGEAFKLSSTESKSYIHSVARYIDQKIKEINSLKSASSINQKVRWLLVALNITDELFKEQKSSAELKKQIEQKDMELEKYYCELGKLQEEELMLKDKLSEMQLEITKLKLDLNELLMK